MIIGANGPEMFVPPTDGTIVPNQLPEGMTFNRQQQQRTEPSGILPEGMTFTPTNQHQAVIDGVAQRLGQIGARSPMDFLGNGMPKGAMEIPANAASAAQWATAYERAVRTGGGPRAMAALNLATRNLGNTLGTPLDLKSLMGGQSG